MRLAMFFQLGQVVGVAPRLEEPLHRLEEVLIRPLDVQKKRHEVGRLYGRPAQEGIKRVLVAIEALGVKAHRRCRRQGPVGQGRYKRVNATNGGARGCGRDDARSKSAHEGLGELRVAPIRARSAGHVWKRMHEHLEEHAEEALGRPIECVDNRQEGVRIGVANRRIHEHQKLVQLYTGNRQGQEWLEASVLQKAEHQQF